VLELIEAFLIAHITEGLAEWTAYPAHHPLHLNSIVLRGWFNYFQHAHWRAMRDVDGWVRMRLRSILRQRHKRRGVGRGFGHLRWPNAYFALAGSFSLEQAHLRPGPSHLP
jgi:hypothetical protein